MNNLHEAKYEKKKSKKEKEIIRNRRFLSTGEQPGEDLTDFVRSMSPNEITDMRSDAHSLERGEKKVPAFGNKPARISRALISRREDGMLQNLRRALINRRLATGRFYTRGERDNEAENSIRSIRRESAITFSDFIAEARLKQITVGPSRSIVGLERQRRDSSERAAFRRAGVRRTQSGGRRIRFNSTDSQNEFSRTAISSYPSQTAYARDAMPEKFEKGKVRTTKERALYLRRLRRQLGSTRTRRGVHVVDILPRGDYMKNDPRNLVSRGKEYHRVVSEVPTEVENVGGKKGDKIIGKAAEVLPGATNIQKGRKKRRQLYTKLLGATTWDPITGVQVASVREHNTKKFEQFNNLKKIYHDLNLVERNRFEKEAEQRKGLPFSRSEIERQRNQRHLSVPGGVGPESEDPRLHKSTVNDRREDNKEIYQRNAKRRNYHKRIIAHPTRYGSANDTFDSVNITNQHAGKGISYDHKQLLKFLRRRRLERTFSRSPSK